MNLLKIIEANKNLNDIIDYISNVNQKCKNRIVPQYIVDDLKLVHEQIETAIQHKIKN